MVFNSLLDDGCFWELVLISLGMKGHGGTVFNSLFSISEYVSIWVEFPFVVSILLFSWLEVSMSLLIHVFNCLVIVSESTTHWVDHVFCAFETG